MFVLNVILTKRVKYDFDIMWEFLNKSIELLLKEISEFKQQVQSLNECEENQINLKNKKQLKTTNTNDSNQKKLQEKETEFDQINELYLRNKQIVENKDFMLKELEGKTILGGRNGGMPAMTLNYTLHQNNINANVDTSVDFANLSGAFIGGNGDYVTLFEPTASELCASKGYKIVFPETLTLNEQISLLKGCSEFVTTDGSTSHNAIFCKNDTKLVIIRKSDYQNGYQAAINKLKDFNIVYIDSNKSIMCNKKQPWVGPFFVYPDKKFCSYLEIKYKGFPFFSFIVYCLRHLFIKFVRFPKRVIKKVLSLVK